MTIDRVQRCWNRITVIGTKLNKVIAKRVQSWNRDWKNAEQFSEDLEIELQVIESTFRSLHKFCHIVKDIQGHFLAFDTVLIVSPTCTYGADIEL